MTLAAKEVTEGNAPVGAALIAQGMDRREGAGRYKAMQSVVDGCLLEALPAIFSLVGC